ncbi:MAG TPA: RNA polymerase sigma factor RpoD/SigA [Candidatus Polarisedimenticolia bacterium]|nr:RNA polymerase sigma factor RpoD/SigA [Candidatus Polarisedimenticolia bacterium]
MPSNVSRGSTCVSSYLSEIRQYPLLTREGEAELVRRMRRSGPGGPEHQELVKSNLAFVVKIANEYRNMGLPFEDLVNEGNIGIIEAAAHFDPARGYRFLTYAVWWIRKAMLGAVARHNGMVHVPAYQMQKLRSVNKAGRKLSSALGRAAGREELSNELNLTIGALDAILQVKSRELSLDAPIGRAEEKPIADLLVDERAVHPDVALMEGENRELVRWALGRLSKQERAVIVHRYGLQGRASCTLREMGERLGVSRERIRQVETKALDRLRKTIARRLAATPPPRAARVASPVSA